MSSVSLLGSAECEVDLSNAPEETRVKLASAIYTKLGTCMPPSADVGSVLTVSKYIAAYGVKGGSCRVMLTKEGSATAMLKGHKASIVDTAIVSDGKQAGYSTLATLSGDGMCRLWEIANQESGGELDAREVLCLRSKTPTAQRVFFHPHYLAGRALVFVLHGAAVSAVLVTRELREDVMASSHNRLQLDRATKFRLESSKLATKVLDMSFDEDQITRNWRAATAHENGVVCLWDLESGGAPPLRVINCGKTPVLSVSLLSSNQLLVGTERNCRISLWSLTGEAEAECRQSVLIKRTASALRSFRATLVQRLSDHTCCLVLFESRSNDVVLLQLLPEQEGREFVLAKATLARVDHTVLCASGDYDVERDLLLCHVVDVDSIGALSLPGHIAFGSTQQQHGGADFPRPPRESMAILRRLSRRASKQSAAAASDFSDKAKLSSCCGCSCM